MAHYLVTGGAGFIGSHLTERLLHDGHSVRVLDDFSTGRRENIDAVRAAGEDRLEVLEASVEEMDSVQQAVQDVDGVFHQAALGSVPRSIEKPLASHSANATGTLNLLEACRRAPKTPRLVFASSSSVYGSLETLPKKEDHPVEPISPYGLTKLMGEEYLRLFHELYDMETVSLRYYNVFGPRQNPKGPYAAVIPMFLKALMKGEAPHVHGDGEQSRDFTYVTNVVDANILAMTVPREKLTHLLFNVAHGGRTSLNRLLEVLGEILDTPIKATYGPERAGDVKHSQADTTRIETTLGYKPRVSFEEGIRLTVKYFKDNRDAA